MRKTPGQVHHQGFPRTGRVSTVSVLWVRPFPPVLPPSTPNDPRHDWGVQSQRQQPSPGLAPRSGLSARRQPTTKRQPWTRRARLTQAALGWINPQHRPGPLLRAPRSPAHPTPGTPGHVHPCRGDGPPLLAPTTPKGPDLRLHTQRPPAVWDLCSASVEVTELQPTGGLSHQNHGRG